MEHPNKYNLDRETVLETLFSRITKDCLDAQQYLSITDILGAMEMIKLSMFSAVHMEVSKNLTENFIGKNQVH